MEKPPVTTAQNVSRDSLVRRVAKLQATPIVAVTILLFIVTLVIAPRSLGQASLLAMIVPAAVLAVAAIGQTLVVQQKGIDLAAPGYITLAGTMVAVFPDRFGTPIWLAVLLSLCVVGLGGWLNGIIITRLNVTPIISSLAMNSLMLGVMWTISGGSTLAATDELRVFGTDVFFSLPLIVWLALVLIIATAVFMARTAAGRRFVGVGANHHAARATGVAVNRYIVSAYIASSVSAGIAGIMLVAYLGKSSLSLGAPYLFPVISAVIVGGAVLAGGRGSVIATAIAALFLSQIVQMVLTFGAPQSVRLLVDALAVAAAASLRLVPWGKIFASVKKSSSSN
jgi:ribose transport system permease protein